MAAEGEDEAPEDTHVPVDGATPKHTQATLCEVKSGRSIGENLEMRE